VLATGGTIGAAVDLIRGNFKTEIVEVAFLIELDFLHGREKLTDVPIHSMMHFKVASRRGQEGTKDRGVEEKAGFISHRIELTDIHGRPAVS